MLAGFVAEVLSEVVRPPVEDVVEVVEPEVETAVVLVPEVARIRLRNSVSFE